MNQPQLVKRVADYLCSIRRKHPLRVAIDGIDAAGKTMFADSLVPVLEEHGRTTIRASIDGFHNPQAVRYARGSLSPEGYYYDSFNYAALRDHLLIPLGRTRNRMYHKVVFDFRTDSPVSSAARVAPGDSILLFDGVFLFRPDIRDLWDVKVFLDVSFEESIARATRRDINLFGSAQQVWERYCKRYIPGQQLYLDECKPIDQADIVIDNNHVGKPILVRCGHGATQA